MAEQWKALGACRDADQALFFTPHRREGNDERERRERKAKEFCDRCPVRTKCLDYALEHGENDGIWGAMTKDERRAERRRRQRRSQGRAA